MDEKLKADKLRGELEKVIAFNRKQSKIIHTPLVTSNRNSREMLQGPSVPKKIIDLLLPSVEYAALDIEVYSELRETPVHKDQVTLYAPNVFSDNLPKKPNQTNLKFNETLEEDCQSEKATKKSRNYDISSESRTAYLQTTLKNDFKKEYPWTNY
jgi:hypothetical protein